ncbi:RNA polymerase sigma factor [Pseudomonas capeferrum]|uniref:RNA polymerase sigma factor n=1 Tax=Pseudomonas capeferrum TaxID=1495066 RepID=UPI001C6148C0|nr:sigma factor [Pseudomonas capeferrum]
MTSLFTPWTGTAPAFQAAVHDLLAHYSDLRRYLCGRLRNPDDATDIAQSSFAQAYAHALDGPVINARTLLFQAARNLCIDQYRRRSTELAALEDWLARADLLSLSVEEIMIARAVAAVAMDALRPGRSLFDPDEQGRDLARQPGTRREPRLLDRGVQHRLRDRQRTTHPEALRQCRFLR